MRAAPRGGFTVRLGAIARGCDARVVQAIGGRGSRATGDATEPGCDVGPE